MILLAEGKNLRVLYFLFANNVITLQKTGSVSKHLRGTPTPPRRVPEFLEENSKLFKSVRVRLEVERQRLSFEG